ncbi:uncharacterized protein [Periplaneta americana]|uniref:uncharacterized protein isoform X2 n=1 Tax=Periplaneta americana TaxID=6978 RepID=UPI0037E76F48
MLIVLSRSHKLACRYSARPARERLNRDRTMRLLCWLLCACLVTADDNDEDIHKDCVLQAKPCRMNDTCCGSKTCLFSDSSDVGRCLDVQRRILDEAEWIIPPKNKTAAREMELSYRSKVPIYP